MVEMIEQQLAIALYTTTKGHYGYQGCYKDTVENLEGLFNLRKPRTKLVHIKYDSSEDLSKMTEYFLNRGGWNIRSTKGDWSHKDVSHAKEYYKDKLVTFNALAKTNLKYALFIEDDWIIKYREDDDFFSHEFFHYLNSAMNFLEKHPEKLCVRINAADQENPDYIEENSRIWTQGPKYTKYGPTFTFQPTIVRISEWYHALRWINKASYENPNLFNEIHCELISGHTMKQFSDDPLPFCFFNPNTVWAEHIGTHEYCANRA